VIAVRTDRMAAAAGVDQALDGQVDRIGAVTREDDRFSSFPMDQFRKAAAGTGLTSPGHFPLPRDIPRAPGWRPVAWHSSPSLQSPSRARLGKARGGIVHVQTIRSEHALRSYGTHPARQSRGAAQRKAAGSHPHQKYQSCVHSTLRPQQQIRHPHAPRYMPPGSWFSPAAAPIISAQTIAVIHWICTIANTAGTNPERPQIPFPHLREFENHLGRSDRPPRENPARRVPPSPETSSTAPAPAHSDERHPHHRIFKWP